MRLHHVQVSCPPGGEEAARAFYGTGLGLDEVAKPAALAVRGGVWFRSFDGECVTAELHVGVEEGFAPARRAHPAFAYETVPELDGIIARLRTAGFAVDERERHTFPGFERAHAVDPHGNRVELLAPEVTVQ
ncbi:VOC family protein [Nocardioides sp. R-C-SC26]|uniref:VOC family protein n=1 Tax=Nocardioides sp. R-C-SC26 TaxID=2870414 RepID=UPI001E31E8C0|nr:VOC family protein [Nocardioides sp. R-C-SC26]